MPNTRKPQERAEILDELLSHNLKWTGPELFEKLNEKLGDIDGEAVTDRTFKRDLDYLEEKRAPLHRPEKGDMFYYYTEKFSLKEIQLDGEELNALKQAMNILKKVDNFQIMDDLDLIIGKLANRIHTNVPDNQTIVQFENHTRAKGFEKFNDLFDAVRDQTALEVTYQSYKHSEAKEFIVHSYLMKEYRNRWWLLGRDGESDRILTLGLDRIKKIKVSKEQFITNNLFNPDTLFDKVIGVSINYNAKPEDIILKINPISVQHVDSKPIHKDQEEVRREKDGSMIIKLNLMINYELKATILGFGDGIEVIEPKILREEIKAIHERSCARYSEK